MPGVSSKNSATKWRQWCGKQSLTLSLPLVLTTTRAPDPITQFQKELQTIPSIFHAFTSFLVCSSKSKNSAVPSLLEQSGRIVEDDHKKAELLNSFFVRQSSLSASAGDPPAVNTEPVTDPSQILTQLEVSLDDVRQALHTLDPRKAPGCDGLPTRLIVMVADEIAPCVHHMFTLSLRTANLPPDWKSAIVSPVYKERGSRQQASNYRPISLLSVLSKCLEKVVFKPLYSHLNRFLPKHQSGFRQKDSTAYQLARLIHTLASALDDGKTAFACFYDLSKAFDRVWHKGL